MVRKDLPMELLRQSTAGLCITELLTPDTGGFEVPFLDFDFPLSL